MTKTSSQKNLFVLDTNVLMHDPMSLFHFEEHDIYIPMIVLEELDHAKKGVSEIARNVRQTSRYLDKLMHGMTHEEISHGLSLSTVGESLGNKHPPHGKLFFQTNGLSLATLPSDMPSHLADNTILAITLTLQKQHPERAIKLVSKDINLRIKASILGIHAEDYYTDRVLDDIGHLHHGLHLLPPNFWDTHGKDVESWQETGHTFYRIKGPLIENWHTNDGIYTAEEPPFEAIVRQKDDHSAVVEVVTEYRHSKHAVWGITARNTEQNFALNALMDPNIDLVSLVGSAGSGKTLLSLAAGLTQTLDHNIYREIIMTRVTVPVGEDIGFLPGTEEEKMTPWMGALLDNLEVLHTVHHDTTDWERAAAQELIRNRIKIRSLNFMRGRTFLNKYIIIDEAQNLTPKQIKTLLTRSGPGTKMVCLGDIGQIDTPYLSEINCGLTYLVDRSKEWQHSAHVTLVRGERSRLADFASTAL
jgi:PhoH-like ATPase